MKIKSILFLCGCIEPGHDGIGDYTMKLAENCYKNNVDVAVLSLYDTYVDNVISSSNLFKAIRIPKSLNESKKSRVVKDFIKYFNPDIISLQFMPYTFNNKGIVFSSIKFFKNTIGNIPFHIMLHELWIGEEKNALLKDKIIGWIQKKSILKFITSLKPAIIHTSLQLNVEILNKYEINSKLLPLFSNIPINKKEDYEWIIKEFFEQKININSENRGEYLIFCIFGTLYNNWNFGSLFKHIKNDPDVRNNKIIISSIGSLGNGSIIWDKLQGNYPDFKFIKIGRRNEQEISSFLQFVNYGIATTPYILLGKSGSFLAMIEHGLPVFCDKNRFEFRFPLKKEIFNDDVIVVSEKQLNFKKFQKKLPVSFVEITTKKLLSDLTQIK